MRRELRLSPHFKKKSRLTYLKVTGGTLKVKALLSNADHVRFGEEVWERYGIWLNS